MRGDLPIVGRLVVPRVALLFPIAAVLVSCSSSHVIIDSHPNTGVETAYATVFLSDDTRIVLAAATGEGASVHATIWRPPTAGWEQCEVQFVAQAERLTPRNLNSELVAAGPEDVDHILAFTVDEAVLDAIARGPASVSACGETWTFDDADRRVFSEFQDALR